MGRVIKGQGRFEAEELASVGTAREMLAQVERLRERARQEGFEEGTARAAALLVLAEQIRRGAVERAMEDVVDLSLNVAGALHERAAREDPAIVMSVAKEALERMGNARPVILRVAPTEALAAEDLVVRCSGCVKVVAEDGIEAGGCIVESSTGTVDARVPTRLEALRRALILSRGSKNGGDA